MLAVQEQPSDDATTANVVSDENYMVKMLAHIKNNATEMREEARKTQNSNAATMLAMFRVYVTGMGRDKKRTEEVPKARSGSTTKGGSWHSLSVEVTLKDLFASTTVKRVGPKSFTMDSEVYVKPSDVAKVEQMLLETPSSPYWDPEAETVAARVDFPVFAGGIYEGAVFVFDETKLAVFSAIDAAVHLPKFREGALIRLEDVRAKVNLVPYLQKNKKDSSDQGHWVLREYFAFTCGSAESTGEPVQSVARYYDENMDRSVPVCVDIRDVYSKVSSMPTSFYVNTAAGGNFSITTRDENGVDVVLNRITLPAGNGDFTWNEKARYICTMVEIVASQSRNQTCELTLTGWEDTAAQFGLDMTPDKESTKDAHVSTRVAILKAHTLTAHFMCEYEETRSMALPKNNPDLVAEREKNDTYTNGSYAARIKDCAVDWRDTLAKRGIEITKDKLISLFADANKSKPSSEKMFKKVTEDGNEVLHFKSVLPGRNPVCNNGDYSDVIPLGNGERPTHQTEDASVFLDREGATFYALTSVPKELAGNYGTTPEEGNAEFDRQKADMGTRFKYVTFVVQKQDVLQKVRK